ncbi:MAG: hypothetical protein HY675_25995 [Chloroflexi bacterium]|nr:hypothetical protein [Chloroflexota bacterium]
MVVVLAMAAAILVVNIPFGYWRANTPALGAEWFVAIHLPVVVVVAVRLALQVPWEVATLVPMVGAFFLGQLAGQRLRWFLVPRMPLRATSCLVMDVARNTRQGYRARRGR